ncbi:hypothetical protein [Georgenia alba]|uniref:Uncharacterized protein n=1 Tax=Georgenia alba TaxID=2233858 RepID=A0ABW2QA59_9MICO
MKVATRNAVGLAGAGLVIGLVVGLALPRVEAEPEVISETATETVRVEVIPSACRMALAEADEGFIAAADFARAAQDGFLAASNMDIAGMEAANADIEAITARLQGNNYRSYADDCLEDR